MDIGMIERNNERIHGVKNEVLSGNPGNVAEARELDISNYELYFYGLHDFLSERFGRDVYSASYFGGRDDLRVAGAMPTADWLYLDKDHKYVSRESSGNVTFGYADLTEGLPDVVAAGSLDFILAKQITYKGDLVRQFPIHEGLRAGGIVASDKQILDGDERFESIPFFDDLSLESFGQRVNGPDGLYWNMEKLFLYEKK